MKLRKKDTQKPLVAGQEREVKWKAPDFLDNLEPAPEGETKLVGEIGFVRLNAQELRAIDLEVILDPSDLKRKPGKGQISRAEILALMQKREAAKRDKVFEKGVKGVRGWVVEGDDGSLTELVTWKALTDHLLSMEVHTTAALSVFDQVESWIKGEGGLEESVAGE